MGKNIRSRGLKCLVPLSTPIEVSSEMGTRNEPGKIKLLMDLGLADPATNETSKGKIMEKTSTDNASILAGFVEQISELNSDVLSIQANLDDNIGRIFGYEPSTSGESSLPPMPDELIGRVQCEISQLSDHIERLGSRLTCLNDL